MDDLAVVMYTIRSVLVHRQRVHSHSVSSINRRRSFTTLLSAPHVGLPARLPDNYSP